MYIYNVLTDMDNKQKPVGDELIHKPQFVMVGRAEIALYIVYTWKLFRIYI